MSNIIPFWNSYSTISESGANFWACVDLDKLRFLGVTGDNSFGSQYYRGNIDGCDTFVRVFWGDGPLWGCKATIEDTLLALSGYRVELSHTVDLIKEFGLQEVVYD